MVIEERGTEQKERGRYDNHSFEEESYSPSDFLRNGESLMSLKSFRWLWRKTVYSMKLLILWKMLPIEIGCTTAKRHFSRFSLPDGLFSTPVVSLLPSASKTRGANLTPCNAIREMW